MYGADNKHTIAFRDTKLLPGEQVIGHVDGWIDDGNSLSISSADRGSIILTNQRVCYIRVGRLCSLCGTFEAFSLGTILDAKLEPHGGLQHLQLQLFRNTITIKSSAGEGFQRLCSEISHLIGSQRAAA